MFSIRHEDQKKITLDDQSNTHKASFRYNDLDDDKKINFEGKKALLFVSVGQEYHEKGKFVATIELVNKYPFRCCDIVMADTLQRFNHFGRFGNEQDARAYTRQAGDEWLKRSKYALSKHNIPHDIIRWDDLLGHGISR